MNPSYYNSSAKQQSTFVPPTKSRLIVERAGSSILRSAGVPKAAVLIDSREQRPYTFMENHSNWIESEERATLTTGDYSVKGMEDLIALERKNLVDLLGCMNVARERFLECCERLSHFKYKAVIIEATLEDIKEGNWKKFDCPSDMHPNGVTGTLDAIEAKWGIPIIYASTNRALAQERAASWLSKHHCYHWLETKGLGRVLQEADKL